MPTLPRCVVELEDLKSSIAIHPPKLRGAELSYSLCTKLSAKNPLITFAPTTLLIHHRPALLPCNTKHLTSLPGFSLRPPGRTIV
jgi:hypothetical protein